MFTDNIHILFNVESNPYDECYGNTKELVQPWHCVINRPILLCKGKASQLISLLFTCVALDVLWFVVKGSVVTDDTSESHNNEEHVEGLTPSLLQGTITSICMTTCIN